MKSKLLIVSILLTINIFAQSSQITYQGVLTDDLGNLINGATEIRFDIYSSSLGGVSLWNETHTVSVTNGLFNVELGSTPLSTLDFSQQLWLQLTVNTTPLTPRIAFNATGYALSGHAISLKISSGAGAGKVLTSDADGNASWQPAANCPTILQATFTGESYDFSISPYCTRFTKTVTGARVGDGVIVNLVGLVAPNDPYTSNFVMMTGWVSNANEVTVQIADAQGGLNQSGLTLIITVIRP